MKTNLRCSGLFLALTLAYPAVAEECTTIQDGTLLRSDGVLIETGFDEWGYNYQAHLFNGGYCEAYRNAAWCEPFQGS